VLCDIYTDDGGWIVIQRRTKGDVDFYRDWASYKTGFGTLDTDFWLGNDNIYDLTRTGKYELSVDIKYGSDWLYFEIYQNFYIASEQDNYRLHVGSYRGTAGDSLSSHNGWPFSTYDVDNDDALMNCAERYHGAWCSFSLILTKLERESLENGFVKRSATDSNAIQEHVLKKKDVEEKIIRKQMELVLHNFFVPTKCQFGVPIFLPNHITRPYPVIYKSEFPRVNKPLFCDTLTDGGGWIVIQRRSTGDVDFYEGWYTYREGFGTLDTDFWLGNDNIHYITSSGKYELRVELKYDYMYYAHYDRFFIGNEDDKYRLHVESYSGNAGDSLSPHNGWPFSTYDNGFIKRPTADSNACQEHVLKNKDVEKLVEIAVKQFVYPETCHINVSIFHPSTLPYPVVYKSEIPGVDKPLLCDIVTDGGGWIVIQRRSTGDVDFYRDWESYRAGFGTIDTDFWLGNDNIHAITSTGNYELRVDLKYGHSKFFAHYDIFSIANEQDKYKLHVESYSGFGGDSMSRHDGWPFSTYDVDNDNSTINCAEKYHGAWWYYKCFNANLNGKW
ncbi:hypothetical protein EGW08_017557, partial [Elysia chlorotica]